MVYVARTVTLACSVAHKCTVFIHVLYDDADSGNHLIRKLEWATRTVTTVAGRVGYIGFADGPATTVAMLYSPAGVTVDPSGQLYVADKFNCRIRKLAGGALSTVAGSSCGWVDGNPVYAKVGYGLRHCFVCFPLVCASGNHDQHSDPLHLCCMSLYTTTILHRCCSFRYCLCTVQPTYGHSVDSNSTVCQ